VTNLELALLGLIASHPAAGYTLRKRFATTPLGHFSDSPGSIYPALRRLHRRGLLRPLKDPNANGRRKQLFSITAKGLAQLRLWLKRPVARAELRHNPDELMLRFVFRAQLFGQASARSFLRQLEIPLRQIIAELEAFLRGSGAALPLTGRLAVEHGLEGYRTFARWAKQAENKL
jgi:DNA-binding PadR family transcriptional regulator